MLKKLFSFYKVPLLISTVLVIVLIALNPSKPALYFAQIFFGAFLGTFFLEIEFFLHAYIFEPDVDFSKTLLGFTKHGDLINAFLFINYHKDEIKEKSINSGVFQIVMAFVCISVVFATTYVMMKALVLSIFANSIYRFAECYYKGNIEEWFWAFKRTPSKRMLSFYTMALIGTLVLCLYFFK
jgi:hypothetical protein